MAIANLFRSSLGKKYMMAVTGLGWMAFVLMHMLSNLLIIFSPEAYNKYSHALVTNPLLPIAEIGLVVLLAAHVYFAASLTLANRRARPGAYAVSPSGPKQASMASRTMAHTGSLILVFVILHIATFKYGTHYEVTYDGVTMRDLHRLVVEVFHKPGYVLWYLLALVFLGFHLSHGFASSFQSLGFNHPKYNTWIKRVGWIYAVGVVAGFIAQPLYVFFFARS